MAEHLATFLNDDAQAVQAYQQCFLNAEVATLLLSQAAEIPRFLQRGAGTALSYTTTLCAVRIKQLTNLTFVASGSKEFNLAWLYSLALAGQVDPGVVVLGERQ